MLSLSVSPFGGTTCQCLFGLSLKNMTCPARQLFRFFTHNGSSSGASSISTVAELCPDSTVLTDDYFTYSGNNVDEAESAVDEWLTELGYNN